MLISAQELVKKSLFLYKDNFKLFLQLAFLVTLPSIIAAALVAGLKLIFGGVGQEFFVSTLYGFLFLIISLVGAVITIWFSIVKVRIVAARYENKDTMPINSYIHSDKKLILPVIVASLLSGLAIFGGFLLLIIPGIIFSSSLAIFGGFLLLIIPGIIFSIWFAFVMYAVVLDNQDSVSALRFSKKIVKGRWWATLWRILVPTSYFIVFTYLLEAPLSIMLNTFNSFFIIIFVTTISYLISILAAPFLVASQVILYSNLKNTATADAEPSQSTAITNEPPF